MAALPQLVASTRFFARNHAIPAELTAVFHADKSAADLAISGMLDTDRHRLLRTTCEVN